MKRIVFLIVLLSISFLLAGCWDVIEAERLGLVLLIGVDLAEENSVRVLIQEAAPGTTGSKNPSGDSGLTTAPFIIHTGIGSTLLEALQQIYLRNNHHIFLAHTRVIILTEELVESKGISSIIDFFERSTEFRRSTWILVAKKNEFKKVFSFQPESNTNTGYYINDIIRNRKNNSLISVNRLGDFIEKNGETGSEAYTSGITTTRNEFAKNNYNINILDTAVFHGDKLSGWLNENETRGLLYATKQLNGGLITVDVDGKKISLLVKRIRPKTSAIIYENKIQINITVDAKTSIALSQADLDFSKKEVIENIKHLQNEEIKKEILLAYDKSKQLNSDIFGFGYLVYKKYPEYWNSIKEEWYSYYPELTVSINVNSVIRHIGLITKPAKFVEEATK